MAEDPVAEYPASEHPLQGDRAQHRLLGVLDKARKRGLVGPAPAEVHATQAMGFGKNLAVGSYCLDLGSGGGLPGLPLLAGRPDLNFVLADSANRRIEFLEWAIDELGLGARASARWGRAEDLARNEGLRGSFDAVVSRSFGPPAAAAECARGFLRPGGLLVVSEPPPEEPPVDSTGSRWAADALASLNFEVGDRYVWEGYGYQTLLASGPCPESVPRRPGAIAKRPRF